MVVLSTTPPLSCGYGGTSVPPPQKLILKGARLRINKSATLIEGKGGSLKSLSGRAHYIYPALPYMSTGRLMPTSPLLPALPQRPPVYQTGSSAEDVILYMVLAIILILIIGLAIFFIVRSNAERDRQIALARVRAARMAPPARPGTAAERYGRQPAYAASGQDVPEAVRAAYEGLGSGGGTYDGAGYESAGYSPEGETYLVAEDSQARDGAGRVDRPPEVVRRRPAADRTSRNLEFLEDLLRPEGGKAAPVRLEEEDRQLLWEESQEPEAQAAVEDEEVLFVDEEPDERKAGYEAPPGRGGTARRPAPATPPYHEEPEPPKDEFASGPLALMLLQKDIEKAVKEGPKTGSTDRGPVRSEGRPVFSKPLEAPSGQPSGRDGARPAPDMNEFSSQLKSLAEKKRAEARRLEDERRSREQRRADEEARRQEEARKKEEMLRREIRGRLRAGISEAQARSAPQGPPGISPAEEEARRAEEERKREEDGRKEERRRRWQELQKKHEVDTIEDVLSKIGIK